MLIPEAPPRLPKWEEPITLTDYERSVLRRLAVTMARRRLESVSLYDPLPAAKNFHSSKAPERLLRGSNRAGKTLTAAEEVAVAVTARDPYKKYPENDGRAFLIGKDGKHLGQVMYRKLFRAGAFWIIKNNDTGLFETFKPWLPEHQAAAKHKKLAPPLIPSRYVKEVAWENKKEQTPNVVRLTNGWELSFFSSLAKPPQGSDLDLVWFDEEIVDPEWYVEMSARLLDRNGKFIWSATPQAGSEQLYDLHQEAETQRNEKSPRIEESFLKLFDNPYIDEEAKKQFAAKLTDEDDYRVRIGGEFAIISFRIYTEFDINVHGVDPFPVPDHWSRFMVVDPGRQVCGALFLTVPPPGSKDSRHIYLYDELYIRNCSAGVFGRKAKEKTSGHEFWAFLIDSREGRKAQTGSGVTVETAYSEALKANGVQSRSTGNGFIWGSDDILGGIEAVRKLLQIGPDGDTTLKIFRHKLPNFLWEIDRYKWSRINNMVVDKPANRNDHLMDALRYAAVYGPTWHRPLHRNRESWAHKRIQEKKRHARRNSAMAGSGVSLGPSGGQ